MSDQERRSSTSESRRKKQDDYASLEEGKPSTSRRLGEVAEQSRPFPELLKGVTFVLSGFVNPERSTLRSKALAMGAEYRPDWTSDCTLLICAFPNTQSLGKLKQNDWISECYNQKKLVDIDRFLMHAGKPWSKTNDFPVVSQESPAGQGNKISGEVVKEIKRNPLQKNDGPSRSEGGARGNALDHLSPSKLKELAIMDLTETVSWLEKQEEIVSSRTDEIRKIAAEGIITCLQDAIDALDRNQDIRSVTDEWMFVPRVVRELVDLGSRNGKVSLTRQELSKLALDCKHAYEVEFCSLDDYHKASKHSKGEGADHKEKEQKNLDEGFDSDSTIEMTEEEIDLAYKGISFL
ncbi:unnamed protein product [Spirodela intermedia]|uniref:BRCT domain-containing protein n=1 Tax=Spirodela intermedia TaxID=51605 RepID=A0A7I8J931_SPIIN|nr:unnamed protein product [Spirodela intermedia]CAA6666295.1 unnamed protein product [Spirodela intermedia]